MSIELKFPLQAYEAIAAGKPWKGQVEAIIRPKSIEGAMRQEEAAFSGSLHPKDYLSESSVAVLTHWNSHPYIERLRQNRGREDCNYPSSVTELKSDAATYNLLIQKLGVEVIEGCIDLYFATCEGGKHIWEEKGVTRSHGYRSLEGFLKALGRWEKTGRPPWWYTTERVAEPIMDTNETLTKKLAGAYCGAFAPEWELVNPSRDYEHFMEAGSHVRELLEKHRGWLGEEDLIDLLVEVVRKSNRPPIEPRHFSSRRLWTVLLPQVLEG